MTDTIIPASISDFIRWRESSGAAERANYQLILSELCDGLNVTLPHPYGEEQEEVCSHFIRTLLGLKEWVVTRGEPPSSKTHGPHPCRNRCMPIVAY